MEELYTFEDDQDVEVVSIDDLSSSDETSTLELEEEKTISPTIKANTELKTVDDQTEEVISEEKPIVVEPDVDDHDGEVVSVKDVEEEAANTIQYEYEEAAGLTDQEMLDAGLGEETYDPRINAKFDTDDIRWT